MARFLRQLRQMPQHWRIACGVYTFVVVAGTALWKPHLLPLGVIIVVANLIVAVLSPARAPSRHRRKQVGTKHLAE